MAARVSSLSRVRRGLSKKLGWAAAAALIGPWLIMGLGHTIGFEWLLESGAVMVMLGMAAAAGLAITAPLVAWVRGRSPAIVSVEAGELCYARDSDKVRIPRREVEGGTVIPTPNGARVEIFLHGGDFLRIQVANEAAGDALLDELEIGPDDRRVRIELAEPSRSTLVAIVRLAVTVLLGFLFLGIGVGAYRDAFGAELPVSFMGPWLASIAGMFAAWQRLRRPPRVVVGRDAVHVDKASGSVTIPLTQIDKVWGHGQAVFIRDTHGNVTSASGGVRLPLRDPSQVASPIVLGVVDRIQDAQRASATAASPEHALVASLDRGGRTLAEWRKALGELLGGDASYRAARLGAEDVEKVLGDATLPADRRIGAALALRAAGVPGAEARIRIAADLSADDGVRVALEQIAEGEVEDAALEDAAKSRHARR